jgi:hypothetical protein
MALYWVPIFGVCLAAALLNEPISWWPGVGLAVGGLLRVESGSTLASAQ